MRGRQIPERLWTWLNGTTFLLLPLLWVGGVSLLALWLPQSPVPLSETAAFARWVAGVHTHLDPYTERLASWGLLSLRTTLWLRLPLAWLALVFAARAVALGEQWLAVTRLTRARRLLILLGLCGLLAGWMVQVRWGWSETGLHAWPGETVTLAHTQEILPPTAGSRRVQRYGAGIFVFQEELALGLDVQARDEGGNIVPLLLSSQSTAQERLRLILNSQRPDGYFGIPESDLVFRVTLHQPPPESEFHVQIYRSSSGALITETTLQNGGLIFAEKLQLQLSSLPVPQLRVVYNPGASFTVAGWGVLAAAVILYAVERRRGRVAAEAAA